MKSSKNTGQRTSQNDAKKPTKPDTKKVKPKFVDVLSPSNSPLPRNPAIGWTKVSNKAASSKDTRAQKAAENERQDLIDQKTSFCEVYINQIQNDVVREVLFSNFKFMATLLVDEQIAHKRTTNEKFQAEFKLELLEKENELLQAKIDARPYIENVLSKSMPAWLFNAPYPVHVKLSVALYFELNKYSKVFRSRIDLDNQVDEQIQNLALACARMYDAFSQTVRHAKDPKPLELTDENWKILFSECRVLDPSHQILLQELLKPCSTDELNSVVMESDPYLLLYIRNLFCDPDWGLIEFEKHILQKADKFGDRISMIFHVTDKNKKYTGEIFMKVFECTESDIDDLKSIFNSDPQPDKKCIIRSYWVR